MISSTTDPEVRVVVRYPIRVALRRLVGTLYDELDAESDDVLYFSSQHIDAAWLERVYEQWRLGV